MNILETINNYVEWIIPHLTIEEGSDIPTTFYCGDTFLFRISHPNSKFEVHVYYSENMDNHFNGLFPELSGYAKIRLFSRLRELNWRIPKL